MRPRQIVLLSGLAIIAVFVLGALIEAAGKEVAVAVAVAAIAVLVASYVWIALVTLRAFGDEEATERLQRQGRAHILIVVGTPLLLIAARPWGPVTMLIGFGVLVLCQFLFVHGMLVAGLILQRRARISE